MRSVLFLLLFEIAVRASTGNIIADVRASISQKDFAAGERQIQAYRETHGITPEMLEALSWLGRGALAAQSMEQAEKYAAETRKLALKELKKRKLDAEPHLPLALGASIEVQARVMADRGQRAEAVSFLEREVTAFRDTSIRTRIQKNIHLLSLEGKAAPPLEVSRWLGPQPAPLEKLKGRPLLLFFWAHWCADCKRQAPILARIASEFGPKGLVLIGPTQHYGYTARGEEATPEQETRYIDQIRKQYAGFGDMPAPLSEENFKNYGASTTPTLVLLDRKGIVQLYHPGALSYEEIVLRVQSVLN